MKYASEVLVNEHEAILFGLEILDQMADMAYEQKGIEVDDINKMAEFFRVYADKCHHGKEEGLLFPAMEKAGIPNEGGPIGAMLYEHNKGRQFIAGMVNSVSDGTLDRNKFIQAASGYIDLLRAHINKENSILFPLGNRMIPGNGQQELLKQFEVYEREAVEEGTHEKYHKLLQELNEKYNK